MNGLGERLDRLAGRATKGVSITDPSLGAALMADQRPKRRGLALGLIAALLVAAAIFAWQSGDSSTTSVAAGQDPDSSAIGSLADGTCAVESALELLQAGIPTYDYEPAGSFDALANQSLAVVAGQVESIARVDVSGRSYIEVTVSAVFDVDPATASDTPRPDIEVIAYQAEWTGDASDDPLAVPVVVEGLDFFAFLSPWSGIRGGWTPGVEGLYVSCNGPAQPVIANGAGPNDPSGPGEWLAIKAAEQAAGQAMADAAAAAEAANDPFFHTIEAGDLLSSIATQYNVTIESIIRANPQMDPDLIIAGERIIIPGASANGVDQVVTGYVVQPGDTLGQIAVVWGVTLEALLAANPDIDPAMLRVGDLLTIPPLRVPLPPPPDITPSPASPATQREELELEQARWRATAPDVYYLRYSELRSEGLSVMVEVQVDSGEIVQSEPALGVSEAVRVWTVDDMFDAALAADVVREITFDPATGAPTLLTLDPDRTVSGDEFTFRVFPVLSESELEAIDEQLAAWLPEPELASPAVAALGVSRAGDSTPIGAPYYRLHQVPGLDVYLYLGATRVCVVAAETQPDLLGSGTGMCVEKVDFLESPLQFSQVLDTDDGTPFLLVVPALDTVGEDWSATGTGGDIDVTERSALLTVDGEVSVGQHQIAFMCECGDQTFLLLES